MSNIQSIFTSLEERKLIANDKLSSKQKRVVRDIIACRTIKQGINRDICESCGEVRLHYNSCRNPACPKCQGLDRALWVDKQKYYSLNISYYHIVFTIPDTLNTLCLKSPKFMYDLLFKSASETLLTLAKDPKYLGAKIGITAVLHTWGQNLHLHPHLHCIVTSGGVTEDNKWVSKDKFFLPVKVVSSLFKGKYLAYLKEQYKPEDEKEFKRIINDSYDKDWVCYIKEPLSNPNSVIEYLGRYTHKIAISNQRILDHSNNTVTFSYKDYKDNNKIKTMTLDELEFFRRYMMHITPKSFCRIRHYGIMSSANKSKRFIQIRVITNTAAPKETKYIRDPLKILNSYFKRDIRICESCKCFRHPLLE